MKRINIKKYALILILILLLTLLVNLSASEDKSLVTFLEIGSTTCIPCKKMQPILKSIEKKYSNQIKVIFHDTNKDREISKKYNVRLIPTQIFLDKDGKEIHRHEGYYPEKEIDKFLKSKGLKPKS